MFQAGVNVSGRYRKWPVFSRPLMAGFGCPPRTEAALTLKQSEIQFSVDFQQRDIPAAHLGDQGEAAAGLLRRRQPFLDPVRVVLHLNTQLLVR